MKKYIQISLLSALLVFPMASAMAADMTATGSAANTQTQTATMSMMELLNKLDAAGYSNILEVDLGDSGIYKVETIDAKGDKIDFTVDPQKPEIPTQAVGAKILTPSEVVKKVTDAGYNNITKIKFKTDKYNVKAHDKDGKIVKLEVNVVTGQVHKDWF